MLNVTKWRYLLKNSTFIFINPYSKILSRVTKWQNWHIYTPQDRSTLPLTGDTTAIHAHAYTYENVACTRPLLSIY